MQALPSLLKVGSHEVIKMAEKRTSITVQSNDEIVEWSVTPEALEILNVIYDSCGNYDTDSLNMFNELLDYFEKKLQAQNLGQKTLEESNFDFRD
jgi:hypothetical protein